MMTTTTAATTGGQGEASLAFHDELSLDGTCGTLEEVYNARSKTVEQQRVLRRYDNSGQKQHNTNNDDDNSDYTGRPGSMSSMFSMSQLLQQGRRIVDDIQHQHQHQQRPPSASDQYTSYHIDKEDDDTNTIDSLSDVFVLHNKKQQKQSTNPKKNKNKKSHPKSFASASVFSTASGGSSSQGSSTGTIRSLSFSIFSSTTKKTSNKSNKNKNKLSHSRMTTSTTADDTTNTEKDKDKNQDTDNDTSFAGSIGTVASLHQDPSETNNDNNNDLQQDEENTVTSSNDDNDKAVSLKKKQKQKQKQTQQRTTTPSTFPQRNHHKLWVCGLSFCFVIAAAIAVVVFHLYYEKGGNQLVVPVHPVGSAAAAASSGGHKDGHDDEDSGGGSNPTSSSSSISISITDEEPNQKVKVDTTNYPTPTPTSHLRKNNNNDNDNDNDIDNDNDNNNDNYIDNDHNSNKNDNEINNDNYNDHQSEVIDVVLSTTPAPSMTHPTTIRGSSSSLSPTHITTTTSPSASPTRTRESYYMDPLIEFLQDNQVYFDKDDSYSPPYLAVQWLAKEASRSSVSSAYYGNGLPALDQKLLQRFAVLTIEFALNRPAPLIISDESVAKTIRVSTNDVTHYEAKSDNTIGIEEVDECEWRGVTCDSGTVVEELSFGSSRFTGTIPSEIKLLQHLKVLDISNNNIHGPIPESLYSIKELHKLYLYQNQLTGTISNQITNWYNMTHLHLSHNELSGSIPLTFISGVNIRPIEYLNLYSNQLTGTLPNNFRFRKTVFADFGRNQFSGPLPDDIGQHWVALRHLYLDHNTFTGTIPYSYPTTGNGRLENLAVNHNHLTGWVPDNWDWSIRKLLAINLHNNSFSSIGYGTCKKSVFNFGEMVEYSADCDVCKCSPFCDLKCGDGQK